MRSLYQYLTEAMAKYMTYNELVGISDIYDKTFDENNPNRIPDDPLFILKKSDPNRICIRNVYKTEACELLCRVFGIGMGEFNMDKYNNCTINPTVDGYKQVRIHVTDKTIGPKIETRDQETATCIVFNLVVDTYDNEQYSKGLDKSSILSMLLDNLQVQFDNTGWYETFALQVSKIIEVLGGIENAKNYRMERFGGHDKYKPVEWTLWKPYHNMVLDYTRFMGGQKDNWDPTDVIIYRKDAEETLASMFNDLDIRIKSLQLGDPIDFVTEELRKLYKDTTKPFMGISLKKLGKSASFETYNMSEGDRIKIKEDPKNLKVWYRKGGKGAYVYLNGDYKFEDVITSNDVNDIKSHTIKLEMRTFGAGINALDVTLESGPSIGKCPTNVWTKILNVSSTSPIEDCIKKFTEFMEKPNFREINTIVQAAAKNGPHCLPFVLIH